MQRRVLSPAVVVLVCFVIPANLTAQDAAEHLKNGKAWSEKREYDKAIAECDQALVLDPKLAEAYSTRGEAWRLKGEYDKALADCNRALAINPKFADAYFVRGWVWDNKGDDDMAIADWKEALVITPDDWKILNNIGVCRWKQSQVQDIKAVKAEADGDLEAEKAYHQKSIALKNDAKAQWTRGVTANPKAADIHSNLGYAYSEANDLDKAEWHLTEAARLSPRSPRPRNNLGRVLLRRSQQFDAQAREAEAKGKTDPAEATRAKELKDEAKMKLDVAIEEFETSAALDPTLLEPRLNVGEVYLQLNQLDKAAVQYRAIVTLYSESEKDRETLNNYSQAWFGLARIAIARKKSDEAIEDLEKAIALNPRNVASLHLLAAQRFLRGECREGEKRLWALLALLPKEQRRSMADQFARQFETDGKTKEAVQAWNFLAWAFATSPEPRLLDAETAMVFAKRAVDMTKQQDPLSLDSLAAAQAASGKYKQAVETAQAAIKLANSQGNKPLSTAISQRLAIYKQEKPYRCDPNGGDRPQP